jgi:hypothetical protein
MFFNCYAKLDISDKIGEIVRLISTVRLKLRKTKDRTRLDRPYCLDLEFLLMAENPSYNNSCDVLLKKKKKTVMRWNILKSLRYAISNKII